MVSTRRRLAAATLVVAAVAGILLHDADARRAAADDAVGGAPVVAEWAPARAAPAVYHSRGWGGAELLSFLQAPRTPPLVPVAGALAGAAAAALAWWLRRGPRGGAGSRLRRTPLPVLRAPPGQA